MVGYTHTDPLPSLIHKSIQQHATPASIMSIVIFDLNILPLRLFFLFYHFSNNFIHFFSLVHNPTTATPISRASSNSCECVTSLLSYSAFSCCIHLQILLYSLCELFRYSSMLSPRNENMQYTLLYHLYAILFRPLCCKTFFLKIGSMSVLIDRSIVFCWFWLSR